MVYKWCCSAISCPVSHFCFFIGVNWVSSTFSQFAVVDPGEGPGGATHLIFRPNWGLKLAEKIFLQTGPSPLISGSWLLDPPLSQDLDPAVVWLIKNCSFYFLIPDNVYVFIWIQIRTSIICWCKYQQNNFFSTVPFHHQHVIMIIMSCHCHHQHHPQYPSILIIIIVIIITAAASPCKMEAVCSLKTSSCCCHDQLYLPLVASKRVHVTEKHVLIGWKQDMFCCQTVDVWVGGKRMFMNVWV